MLMTHRPQSPTKIAQSIEELADDVAHAASGRTPFLLAVAGAPGSGKSTLADKLALRLDRPACVIPMDGFHLDNDTLDARGLLARKGAPNTFDHAGFTTLVERLKTGETRQYPTFDRTSDRVIPNGGSVPKDVEILIFEGNYLLFDDQDWIPLQAHWDASVWLDVPRAELEKRLIQRWIKHGLSKIDARNRAQGNDLPNAAKVMDNRVPSTWVLPFKGR